MSKKRKGISKKYWLTGLLSFSLVIGLAAIFSFSDTATKVSAQKGEGPAPPIIYDNGPLATGTLSNSGAMAPAGNEWSEVQNETGNMTESNTLSGVSCSVTATVFRCADDFTVPPGETWTIDEVIVYAYQTGFAGATSPFTAAQYRIWDGIPDDPGSTVLSGDETTNQLISSDDAFLFRIFNSAVPPPGATPGTTRHLWVNRIGVSPSAVLGPGTYWVDWNTNINGVSGHFAPPVTIPGVRGLAGWNARQRVGGGVWNDVIDAGNPGTAPDFPLDFPFKLAGSIAGGGTPDPNPDFDGDGETDYSIVRDASPPPVGPIPGTGTGGIPDGGPGCGPLGAPLEVSFDASGISGTITNVSVDMTATHTWVGDVNVTLIAPDATQHVIFASTQSVAANGCGDSSDLGNTYEFNDTATGDWWAESLNGTGTYVMAGGAYRTSSAGDVPGGGAPTSMNAAFAAANPTGTWKLRFEDGGGGDVGSVTAANLTITTGASLAPNVRRSLRELQRDPGFKPLPLGNRDNAAPANHGTDLAWYISNSGDGSFTIQGHGNPATDFWVPADYDGDGQSDIAVWRGVAPAGPMGGFFYTFTSSTSTVNEIDFGIAGDNPTVVGDYDGDGSADPAVYRCPSGGGQCTFYYKGSAGGGDITYYDWGNDSSTFIRPYPGDFDGDGKNDFCIFQSGVYSVRRSSDGGTDYTTWGGALDPVIAPGDYDGDGKTDFMNVVISGSDVQWWLRERDGGTSVTTWGALIPGFAEFATPGDYDGDGSTDIGVWRRDNGSNSNSFFYTLRSSDGMLETFEWGSMGDAPVPGWNGN